MHLLNGMMFTLFFHLLNQIDMLQSQNSAYRLQDKMNEISSDEFAELQQYSNMEVLSHASEYYDYFYRKRQEVHEKYNKLRKRAIWWAAHGTDVLVLAGILFVVVLGVYLFFF